MKSTQPSFHVEVGNGADVAVEMGGVGVKIGVSVDNGTGVDASALAEGTGTVRVADACVDGIAPQPVETTASAAIARTARKLMRLVGVLIITSCFGRTIVIA